jgi:hypothetical protein
VAGTELGGFKDGGLLSFDDLYMEGFSFDWDDTRSDFDFDDPDAALDGDVTEAGGAADELMGGSDGDVATATEETNAEAAVKMWRERACELEDQVQYLQARAACRASGKSVRRHDQAMRRCVEG